MSLIKRVKLRRLIPASAVAAVLAFAYLSPLPAEASKAFNCGVKAGYGYAFHDHGKPCPNRPFPGKGKGILEFAVSGLQESSNASATTEEKGNTKSPARVKATAVVVANRNATSVGSETQSSVDQGHGRGKGRGRGNGESLTTG